jgi:type I restriction enzyme M protein
VISRLPGQAQADFLAEGAEVSLPLAIDAPAEPGMFNFDAQWRADRIDGKPRSGSIQLAVEVRPSAVISPSRDLGTSPYTVGNPINRRDMFFGREDVIQRIVGQLSTDHRANVILLEGNRRAGKTSILRRLVEPGELPGWIAVYCTFQAGEGSTEGAGLPTREVFRLIARQIGWEASKAGFQTWFPGHPAPEPSRPFQMQFAEVLAEFFRTERPAEAFQIYLEAALEACRPMRILLLLDEFDKLQEGIDVGVTSPQVPENLRYLLHEYPDLSAILSGSRRLKRLREEYWSALFGIGHRIGVSALAPEAARELVTRPVAGRLTYPEQARDRLVELCARQPYLIQSLCNRVFENAARSGSRTVTVAAVDEAARDLVEDNEHFLTLWGYAKTDRRRMLLALCDRLSDGPDPVTFGLLEAKLEEYRIPLPGPEALGEDIEYLRELELLELVPGAGRSDYRLGMPLMALWIRRHKDFEDLSHRAALEGEEAEVE